MVVVMYGGEKQDPDRPGKWIPAGTAHIRCSAAFQAWKDEADDALSEVTAKHAAHMEMLRVPWPPTKAQ